MKASNSQESQKTVLKQIREDLGLTQIQFSALTGISLGPLQRAESGEAEPNMKFWKFKRFYKAAKDAGYDPDDLPDMLSSNEDISHLRRLKVG